MERLNSINNHLTSEKTKQKIVDSAIDWLGFSSTLPKEANEYRLRLRKHFEEKIDHAKLLSQNEKAEYPHDLWPMLKESDAVGYFFEKPYGHGHDMWKYICSIIESARVDASMSTMFMVHTALFGHTIEKYGSEELKAEYLPKMINCEQIGAWA